MTGWRPVAMLLALAVAEWPVSGHAQFPGKPTVTDPEAYDAIGLFSRLCVATRGDRDRAMAIIGTGDNSVEKLEQPVVNGLEGKAGGVGWTVRMPLGEKILFEFGADGTCIVRAPRVDGKALEAGLVALLDQISASGQFKYRKRGEDSKIVERVTYRVVAYSLVLPDTGKTAEIQVATNDGKTLIQGALTFVVPAGKP